MEILSKILPFVPIVIGVALILIILSKGSS